VVGPRSRGHAGGVLHDGLAAAEDAVHQRGLAHVGAADDRDDRQRRQVRDGVGVVADVVENVEVLVVEVVLVQSGAQRRGALRDERVIVVEVGQARCDLRVELGDGRVVELVSHARPRGYVY
jgi:hypothetical protein